MAEIIQGMAELKRKLAKISQKSGKNAEIKVGFLQGAAYPEGEPVAAVAAVQEFGAAINVAERTNTLYRSLGKNGKFNKKGRFVKKGRSNFASEHAIGAHTIVIPPRPFMRTTIADKKDQWFREFVTLMKQNDLKPEVALKTLAEEMVNDVQASIRNWTEPPNAPSTVREKKGRNKPLQNTERMLKSVSYEIKG